MFYLPRRLFKKEVKNIDSQLFCDFYFFNKIRFGVHKNKEHCLSEDKHNFVDDNTSSTFNMLPEERMLYIAESLAVSLGFTSYYDYQKKTKFFKDIKKLEKLTYLDKKMIKKIKTSFIKNLNDNYNFKVPIDDINILFINKITEKQKA